MKKFFKSLTALEIILWVTSSAAVIIGFFACGNTQYHYLIGSLLGICALVFISKGNPFGQVITLVFAVFYGVISFSFKYYGEMITYLGMSAPFAVAAIISWFRNPYKSGDAEVKINTLSKREWAFFAVLAVVTTIVFYFILKALHTANLIVSTVSVLTSVTAAYLTARRCRFYAIFYALNDVVLIVMWSLATAKDIYYLPMIICFCAFLALDSYAFFNWTRMLKRQKDNKVD